MDHAQGDARDACEDQPRERAQARSSTLFVPLLPFVSGTRTIQEALDWGVYSALCYLRQTLCYKFARAFHRVRNCDQFVVSAPKRHSRNVPIAGIPTFSMYAIETGLIPGNDDAVLTLRRVMALDLLFIDAAKPLVRIWRWRG
jgi:hypothetical protein